MIRTQSLQVAFAPDPQAPVRTSQDSARLGRRSLHSLRPQRFRIKSCQSARVALHPDSTIARTCDAPYYATVKSILGVPPAPPMLSSIPHGDAVIGSDPQPLLIVASHGPHHVVG